MLAELSAPELCNIEAHQLLVGRPAVAIGDGLRPPPSHGPELLQRRLENDPQSSRDVGGGVEDRPTALLRLHDATQRTRTRDQHRQPHGHVVEELVRHRHVGELVDVMGDDADTALARQRFRDLADGLPSEELDLVGESERAGEPAQVRQLLSVPHHEELHGRALLLIKPRQTFEHAVQAAHPTDLPDEDQEQRGRWGRMPERDVRQRDVGVGYVVYYPNSLGAHPRLSQPGRILLGHDPHAVRAARAPRRGQKTKTSCPTAISVERTRSVRTSQRWGYSHWLRTATLIELP